MFLSNLMTIIVWLSPERTPTSTSGSIKITMLYSANPLSLAKIRIFRRTTLVTYGLTID